MKSFAQILCKPILIAVIAWAALFASGIEQPEMRVGPTASVGPRVLEDQTEKVVIRDYKEAWQGLSNALAENRTDLLDADFVGIAKEKLINTIREQQKLGIQTRYTERSHDVKLVFYSPEGLSIQLLDTVEYDVQITDHEKAQAVQHLRTRYVAVLTPTEVRWKVRIFQGAPE